MPKTDCQFTRQNKIIVTCNDKQDLEIIKNKLEAVEDIIENLEIKEQQHKMSRVIIFGAPEALPMLKHQDEAEGSNQKTDVEQFELHQKKKK